LDDLQEVQSARLSHRPDGPAGSTPEVAIRPSPQEKNIGKRLLNQCTKTSCCDFLKSFLLFLYIVKCNST